MKILTFVFAFITATQAFAAGIDCSKVSANTAGVTRVTFEDSRPLANHYNKMIVKNRSGQIQEFTSQITGEAISSGTLERVETASFDGAAGIVNIRYLFFARPQDQIPGGGWAQKNGVNMSIVLPPATERIVLNCVRSF